MTRRFKHTKQNNRRHFQKAIQVQNITQNCHREQNHPIILRLYMYREWSFDLDHNRNTHHPGSRPLIRIGPASMVRYMYVHEVLFSGICSADFKSSLLSLSLNF